MFKLNSFTKIGVKLYLFVYLIFPYSATSQTENFDLRRNLEIALNSRNLEYIKKTIIDEKNLKISDKFSKIIQEFPDSKWKIKKLNSVNINQEIYQLKVFGKKNVNGESYILESNFNFLFSFKNGKITNGTIKKLFTLIRNDENKIDISFNIPDRVLTGKKYDIDVILNKPLEEIMVAGGIEIHQVESFLEQDISLEPLVSGGIFKVTRAPSKPGIQIWSGIIAHPEGIITFTKSVDIVDKL